MKLLTYILMIGSVLAAFQLHAAEGVTRSNFTTAIDNREPVDEVSDLADTADNIYYFTEIKGLKGQTITHRWEQNGVVQATVPFQVGGDRWRVWSSKNLQPELTGTWQVMVVDEAGNVLSQNSFNYGSASDNANEQSAEIADESDTNTMQKTMPGTMPESMPGTMQETMPQEMSQKMNQTSEGMPEEDLHKIAPAAGKDAALEDSDEDSSNK